MEVTVVLRFVASLLVVVGLNLHYVLFGRPFLERPLTSRPVLSLAGGVLSLARGCALSRARASASRARARSAKRFGGG